VTAAAAAAEASAFAYTAAAVFAVTANKGRPPPPDFHFTVGPVAVSAVETARKVFHGVVRGVPIDYNIIP